MAETTNYSLPYPEGSDTVNLLTVLPALAQLVDAQMKVNANTGIQRGTHSKSGTVNSVTVSTDLATGTFFTFVAADDFVEGDSFTFNGEVIAARNPQGSALKTGAFTINQNVLCCNYNGILTIYTNQSSIAVDTQLDRDSENAIANAAVTAAVNAINAAIGNADISSVGANVKAAILALNSAIGTSQQAISGLNGELTANSKKFYFDYKNGKYGFNTEANRGADTFTPFSSGITSAEILLNEIAIAVRRTVVTEKSYKLLSVTGRGRLATTGSRCYVATITADNGNILLDERSGGTDNIPKTLVLTDVPAGTTITVEFAISGNGLAGVAILGYN